MLVILLSDSQIKKWRQSINQKAPEIPVKSVAEITDPTAVTFILTFTPKLGSFGVLPNLKACMSMGAGVESILAATDLSPHIPVARVIDPSLANMMSEYIL